MNGLPKPRPAHTFPKGVINGPEPRTARGRKRRAANTAKGIQYRNPTAPKE